jgi:uncharacterized protein YciI
MAMHYLLFYEKVPDHEAREVPLRDAHRDHVFAAIRRGDVALAGSLADPMDGAALLLFRGESPAAATMFARADPYVINGVVCRWWVREWQTITSPLPLPD